MKKKSLFEDSFIVSDIMCSSCSNSIENALQQCIQECITEKLLPADAQLNLDSEPSRIGLHRLFITIESEDETWLEQKDRSALLSLKIKKSIPNDILTLDQAQEKPIKSNNKTYLFLHALTTIAIITLTLLFPPSILLTIVLTSLSFIVTGFGAREYLFQFLRDLRHKKLSAMPATISVGWLLSLAHTLFHVITMPLCGGVSIIFMNFIMPIMLIACINSMDEIKRFVWQKSRKFQLQGINSLFPQMADTYPCYQISLQQSQALRSLHPDDYAAYLHPLLEQTVKIEIPKKTLKEGMFIEIKPGQCFPVDCLLIHGYTVVDASLLTGEPQQNKQVGQEIKAGAINLGQTVIVLANKNSYNSTVNHILFRSNRSRTHSNIEAPIPRFAYLYTMLVILALLTAILAPIAFGIVSLPLILQHMMGILFSICPCTIAIAHYLPKLISTHQRNKKGIHFREERLEDQTDDIHTIIFDKTGTLTTGNSVVDSSTIEFDLWQRIYLVEKEYGGDHPIAHAIIRHYESHHSSQILFNQMRSFIAKPGGLTAVVQEKELHVGNADYLQDWGIQVPLADAAKLEQGLTPIFVAEEGKFQGIIYIKHELRAGVRETLLQLKNKGKKIIMLTGDNALSAQGFNQQMGSIFDPNDIHAGKSPQEKEDFLNHIMSNAPLSPKGYWFVGDGLNDAQCCRMLSEKGGISCSVEENNKSSFFTDICLNGSLAYLFEHHQLNRACAQTIRQNQWILACSTGVFLAFILSFSLNMNL